MPLPAGHRIGPYEIVSPLGAGGMGEVYRATDTNLGRQVALKVLPAAFATDVERMARFKREAQVLASLNHPNIATIHGIEGSAIVMELVEGKDLAGPLPLDEALPIARQIAEALEAAHEKGIVHRDLKPANIKITPQGVVRLLDFGLAKAVAEEPADMSNSPTLSLAMTSAGMILGTAAYMSPEQARGKTVDRRADIWAFGVVLLETLTGKKTYPGETIADTLAAVITKDPALETLPEGTPPFLRTLLHRCLEKDPKRRLRDIGEARIAIDDYLLNPDKGTESSRQAEAHLTSGTSWLRWALAAAVALLSAGIVYWQRQAPSPPLLTTRLTLMPPTGYKFSSTSYSISPDGKRLVASLLDAQAGTRQMWLREMDSTKWQQLPGTDGAIGMFWSPDSRSIGFRQGGKLKRSDLKAAQVQVLCDADNSSIGASWGADGVILFASGRLSRQPIMRVAATGGKPAPALKSDALAGDGVQLFPRFLPDGRHFLFNISGNSQAAGTYWAGLDGKDPVRRIHDSQTEVEFAADESLKSGYLFFRQQSALMAVRFNAAKGEVAGEPFLVLENVSRSASNRVPVTASMPAHVIAISENAVSIVDSVEIVALDRTGRKMGKIDAGSSAAHIDLSPDGGKLLSERYDPQNAITDIWTFDLARKTASRITFGTGTQGPAVWSADGRKILFQGNVGGEDGLYSTPADGSGRPELLFKGALHHLHASTDGKSVLFEPGLGANRGVPEVHLFSLHDGGKPQVAVRGNASIAFPQFSPDGRWVAFGSAESGQNEIYVQSLPAGSGRWQVSNGGGTLARWRRDGREIVYYDGKGHVLAAPVTPRGSALEFGIPVKLFDANFLNLYFAISSDGQRFYANMEAQQAGGQGGDPQPLTIVLNWAAGLKR